MEYQQALDYLNSFINYERTTDYKYRNVFRLERTKRLLEAIGNPHKQLKTVHVAGTKGKGSTAALISSILKEAGFKVGLYTSPHLVDFRERIRIVQNTNTQPDLLSQWKESWISKEELADLSEKLKQAIENSGLNERFSFFEIYTALAFLYFKKREVDFAVLEAGLGGRLDATNVVWPHVSVITDISFEHTDKLGRTLGKIAKEKAGIIKEDSVVITSLQRDEAGAVIRKIAKTRNAKLFEINRQIFFEEISLAPTNSLFNLKSVFTEYPRLNLNLAGRHQIVNASLAISACEALRFFDIFVSQDAVRRGLQSVYWPGRLQVINKNPLIILDGAQNVASASCLKDSIKNLFNFDKLILVLGISKDKDIKGICKQLDQISDSVILTKAENPRAAEPVFIRKYFSRGKNISLTDTVIDALNLAKSKAAENDLVLITGSLFVVGEALGEFEK